MPARFKLFGGVEKPLFSDATIQVETPRDLTPLPESCGFARFDAPADEFRKRRSMELLHDARTMGLDGLHAYAEFVCD
jgi:hypothetical protein